jgi:hypothetical protein
VLVKRLIGTFAVKEFDWVVLVKSLLDSLVKELGGLYWSKLD